MPHGEEPAVCVARLIEDVSQDVDAAQGRIDTALMKMAKVLRMTDGEWVFL